MEDQIAVSDQYLSAAIKTLSESEPTCTTRSGRLIFIFPNTPAVQSAILAFNSGASGNLSEYARYLREARGAIVAAKKEAGRL